MSHVFLAYTGQDVSSARLLRDQIEGAGFDVWPDSSGPDAQKTWGDHVEDIDDAIRASFALVVVLTPAAQASSQIMYEWTFALGVGVKVIPVLCRSCEVHPRLARLEYLDFTDAAVHPWGKLIGHIQEARSHVSGPDTGAQRDRPVLDPRRERPPLPPPQRPTSSRPPSFLDRLRRRDDMDDVFSSESDDQASNVPRLLRLLETGDRDVQISAVRRLADLNIKSAVPNMIKLLRNDDWRARDAAAQALGKLKAAAAVPALLETLRVGRPGPFGRGPNNSTITWAIRQIGTAAVPVLIDALSDADWRIRLEATDALGDIGDITAVPALTGALHDPEQRVRWRAAEALGQMSDVTAVPALIEALRESSDDLRMAAAWALGHIGHPDSVPALIKLLHDRDWRVRWSAAEALWQIGEAAVPALLDALHDDDEYVRRAALRALTEIGEAAFPGLLKSLSDASWDVRWAAASALQEIGDAAVPFLVQALDDDDWRASWAAAEALKQIGTPEALRAVESWRGDQLEDGDPSDDRHDEDRA